MGAAEEDLTENVFVEMTNRFRIFELNSVMNMRNKLK